MKAKLVVAIGFGLLTAFGVGWQCGKHSVPGAGVWVQADPRTGKVMELRNNSSAGVTDFVWATSTKPEGATHWAINFDTWE